MSGPTPVRAGIPWYVHPAQDPQAWERLATDFADANGIIDGFVVINVHDGPGNDDDPYYEPALARLTARAPGLVLLGYVDLDYGRRGLSEVWEDAAAWRRRYGIDGVMLDRFPSGREPADAAGVALRAVARLRAVSSGPVVGNPGVVPVPELSRALDITCVFEGTGADYLRRQEDLSGLPGAWHLVHSCTPDELRAASEAAGPRGAEYAFVTTGVMPNPWDGYGEDGAR